MKNLFERFTDFLSKREPSLIAYSVDVGKKSMDDFTISGDLDSFRIEVGVSEILVVYGFFHDHFLSPDEPEVEAFSEILDFSRSIVSEKLVAFYVYDSNNKMVETIIDAPGSQPNIPEGGSIKLRSFKGSYNKG